MQLEHNLQSMCYKYASLFPEVLIFAAYPAQGKRSLINGSYMKKEGMITGHADVVLYFKKQSYFC